jgi:hypothetical protein
MIIRLIVSMKIIYDGLCSVSLKSEFVNQMYPVFVGQIVHNVSKKDTNISCTSSRKVYEDCQPVLIL